MSILTHHISDDISNNGEKNVEDTLFKRLKNYHQNSNLIIQISLVKFLETRLNGIDNIYKPVIHREKTKLPLNWSSKVPRWYKCSTIFGDLSQSKRNISTF